MDIHPLETIGIYKWNRLYYNKSWLQKNEIKKMIADREWLRIFGLLENFDKSDADIKEVVCYVELWLQKNLKIDMFDYCAFKK